MDITLADQHILRLEDRLSADEARQRAMDRRTGAFGSGLGSLFSRPNADDIELVDSQRRLEPFWHVSCSARYVYDRAHEYAVAVSGPAVRSVTALGQDFLVSDSGRAFVIPTVEHCREEFSEHLYLDGGTGAALPEAQALIAGPSQEVADLVALEAENTIVVAPEQRASFVVRQLLTGMLKPLQADTVHEESITFDQIDLYYRPWWAFEFHWKSKDKKGVIELDAITGQERHSSALMARLGRTVTRDSLFDIGADTVSLLVPGGGIAVKVAKMAIDHQKASS